MVSETYRRGPLAFVVTSQPDEQGSVLSVVQLAADEIPAPGAAQGCASRGRLGAQLDPVFR